VKIQFGHGILLDFRFMKAAAAEEKRSCEKTTGNAFAGSMVSPLNAKKPRKMKASQSEPPNRRKCAQAA
jgi:hypothetical protein